MTDANKTQAVRLPAKIPVSRKRFAEPEIITPNSGPGSTLALWRAIVETRRPRRVHDTRIVTLGVLLLTPAWAVIAAVILLALLGYFVLWLCFVGILFTVTVVTDQGRRWWHRTWSVTPLGQRALGYPGR